MREQSARAAYARSECVTAGGRVAMPTKEWLRDRRMREQRFVWGVFESLPIPKCRFQLQEKGTCEFECNDGFGDCKGERLRTIGRRIVRSIQFVAFVTARTNSCHRGRHARAPSDRSAWRNV